MLTAVWTLLTQKQVPSGHLQEQCISNHICYMYAALVAVKDTMNRQVHARQTQGQKCAQGLTAFAQLASIASSFRVTCSPHPPK